MTLVPVKPSALLWTLSECNHPHYYEGHRKHHCSLGGSNQQVSVTGLVGNYGHRHGITSGTLKRAKA